MNPGDSLPNQKYYVRNLPSKNKGILNYELSNVPEGKYNLQITKVGYKSNDAYTTYFEMGMPKQLTKMQVQKIKEENASAPTVNEDVEIKSDKVFKYHFEKMICFW